MAPKVRLPRVLKLYEGRLAAVTRRFDWHCKRIAVLWEERLDCLDEVGEAASKQRK